MERGIYPFPRELWFITVFFSFLYIFFFTMSLLFCSRLILSNLHICEVSFPELISLVSLVVDGTMGISVGTGTPELLINVACNDWSNASRVSSS